MKFNGQSYAFFETTLAAARRRILFWLEYFDFFYLFQISILKIKTISSGTFINSNNYYKSQPQSR